MVQLELIPYPDSTDTASQSAVSTWSCDRFSDGHLIPSRAVGAYSRNFSRTIEGKMDTLFLLGLLAQ